MTPATVARVKLGTRGLAMGAGHLGVLPETAELTWSTGDVHKAALHLCSAGRRVDVFEAKGFSYLLKVGKRKVEKVLPGRRLGRRSGVREEVMAEVYGEASSNLGGGGAVWVQVVERPPHTLRSWLLAVMSVSPCADANSVNLVFSSMAQVVLDITHMADKLGVYLQGLTLDKVGVRRLGAPCFLNEEDLRCISTEVPEKRFEKALGRWLNDLKMFWSTEVPGLVWPWQEVIRILWEKIVHGVRWLEVEKQKTGEVNLLALWKLFLDPGRAHAIAYVGLVHSRSYVWNI